MRLITRRVYRAFPELDAFGDEQCRRFVRAAAGPWWASSLAVASSVGVAIVVTVLLLFCTLSILRSVRSDSLSDSVIYLAFGMIPISVFTGLCAGLLLKDLLLRLSIGRVLRRGGTCLRCRYSLLGVPVASDAIVVCPECGTRVAVNPALGELVHQDGVTLFRPKLDANAQRILDRRVAWWRRFGRRGVLLSIAVLVAVGLAIPMARWLYP